MYNAELTFVLGEYDRIVNKIRPNTKSLLVPHLEDLEYKLRPGMNILTWTSMNIDGYLQHVHAGLNKLEQLIINTEYGDETQDQVSEENAEEDQYFKDQIAQLYNPLYHGL